MIKRHALIMSLLITFLIGANTLLFSFISSQRENLIIKRVIDGDTLVFNNNKTARLLNINTPEKKSPLSQKSFNFLKDYENKSVEVEFKSRDKYGRDLVKIYTPKYLNLDSWRFLSRILNTFETKGILYKNPNGVNILSP